MSNCGVTFSILNFHSNGHDNGFPKAHFFLQCSEHHIQMPEKYGHNGCYDQHIKLKIIHVYLILFNNMPPKFQVIVLITYCFIAFFVSDIIFAHRERLTLEMKFKTFPKVSILEKNMILAVWVYAFS